MFSQMTFQFQETTAFSTKVAIYESLYLRNFFTDRDGD